MRLINHIPGRVGSVFLAALPFVLLVVAYAIASDLRLSVNPQDK